MRPTGQRLPVHVVAYTDSPGVGGAEISLAHLVAGTRHDVTVVGSSPAVVARVAGGRPAHALPRRAHPALLARLRPHVVHANLAVPWGAAVGLPAAQALSGTRVVAVQQLPLRTTSLPVWLRTRALALRLDAHVAVGAASARRIEDFYALGRGTVRSIGNLVPDHGARPVEPHDGFVVGAVGRLDAMKDHALLVRAAACAGARLVVVGEGSLRRELTELAAAQGVPLKLPGWSDDPWSLLATADVVALPSRSEGWPLSLVEAMLAGRPVVATRVGAVAEVVPHGTGVLVDSGDLAALTAALVRLRDDPALREQLGARARAHATAHLTVDRMVTAYEELWAEVCAAPRSPRLRVPAARLRG